MSHSHSDNISSKSFVIEQTLGDVIDKREAKAREITPNYYGAKCSCGKKIDPYTICDAYDSIQASAHHHAVKKLLRAGTSHKPLEQDIQEVIDSLNRWMEMINEK